MKVWALYMKVPNSFSYDGTEDVLHGLYINEELAQKAKDSVEKEYSPFVECLHVDEE